MKRKRPQDRSPAEKLRLVAEASKLTDEELGEFLRREGIHQAQLDQWEEAIVGALGQQKRRSSKKTAESKRIRKLESELRRKEKALAEAAALLVLKKKAQEIWGDEGDDT